MRFIDETKFEIHAGHGGGGAICFRREKYIPNGGPSGGEGGKGGNVYFVSNNRRSTLQDLRYKRKYRANNGLPGRSNNKTGKDGEDLTITVPVGTIIKDQETGEILFDFTENGQSWLACRGGRGGKGNAHFATATLQAPKFAQPGEEGESKKLKLELKLLADVGIIGYPNAGKSTLISKISAARPKIADYAFTTLVPNLGVVELAEYYTIVVADIPGLIEGAHQGEGLGTRFLKHVERTELFIHLIDVAFILKMFESYKEIHEDPAETIQLIKEILIERYRVIRNELKLFNEALAHKPEIVVVNKIELLTPELQKMVYETLRNVIHSIRGTHPATQEPLMISAITQEGLADLKQVLMEHFHPKTNENSNTAIGSCVLPDGTLASFSAHIS